MPGRQLQFSRAKAKHRPPHHSSSAQLPATLRLFPQPVLVQVNCLCIPASAFLPPTWNSASASAAMSEAGLSSRAALNMRNSPRY